jgi:lipocalin
MVACTCSNIKKPKVVLQSSLEELHGNWNNITNVCLCYIECTLQSHANKNAQEVEKDVNIVDDHM